MTHRQNQLALICFTVSLGILLLFYIDPAESNIYPPSLTREWGGFYCAGCGMLRAIHQMLHGNWQAAFRLNPLLVISLPYIFYWILPYFFKYFYRLNLYTVAYPRQQLIVVGIITIVYGALRNTKIPVLYWLIPPS